MSNSESKCSSITALIMSLDVRLFQAAQQGKPITPQEYAGYLQQALTSAYNKPATKKYIACELGATVKELDAIVAGRTEAEDHGGTFTRRLSFLRKDLKEFKPH